MDPQPTSREEDLRWRRRVSVHGVVQGIGFRPYVYHLAKGLGLTGFVRNTSLGVVIEVEGNPEDIAVFAERLPRDGPSLMRIASMESLQVALRWDNSFSILESEEATETFAWIPPDIATCTLCLAEMRDRSNRRYAYPFINCTHCGPRYSIIKEVPYDRAKTTMASFKMCQECSAEFDDPEDRRFHAQPNACSVCGPRLYLVDSCGKTVPLGDTEEILGAVVNILDHGGIVAWKGLGGYQLACDARNQETIEKLRKGKRRNAKAFAVMVRDVEAAKGLCLVSDDEASALSGAEKPIVLLKKRESTPIAAAVAPGNPWLGIMLPYTPMHELLFRILEERCGTGAALVMTSGNISEEPIVIHEKDAEQRLQSIVDVFVHHDRPIHMRVDDSVVRLVDGREMLLRRSRGYAPQAIRIGAGYAQGLACGAQLKSTFCLAKAGYGILSQHLGDLENYETLQFFEETLERMQHLFEVVPQFVAHDLHPAYLSTKIAQKLPVERRIGVQHHHAHIASCMVEHDLEGSVLGVAWDGTGYGLDGAIWGGEFLIADLCSFDRFGHLRNVPLAGGDTAIREPWRVARSYLYDAFDNPSQTGLSCHDLLPEVSIRTIDTMLGKRIHTVETSSCGRLFDAVASLLGLHQVVSFEGQAAMALEAIAEDAPERYEFVVGGQGPVQVDMRPTIQQIVTDIRRGEPVGRISGRFHNTMIAVVVDLCSRMRKATGIGCVCLSGGSFQNVYLLNGCLAGLRSKGFEVYFQQQVPANDGGIALGQAAIACELIRRGL